jgi:hypothetical protein
MQRQSSDVVNDSHLDNNDGLNAIRLMMNHDWIGSENNYGQSTVDQEAAAAWSRRRMKRASLSLRNLPGPPKANEQEILGELTLILPTDITNKLVRPPPEQLHLLQEGANLDSTTHDSLEPRRKTRRSSTSSNRVISPTEPPRQPPLSLTSNQHDSRSKRRSSTSSSCVVPPTESPRQSPVSAVAVPQAPRRSSIETEDQVLEKNKGKGGNFIRNTSAVQALAESFQAAKNWGYQPKDRINNKSSAPQVEPSIHQDEDALLSVLHNLDWETLDDETIQEPIVLERRRRSHTVDDVHESCTDSSSQREVDIQVPLNDLFSGGIKPIAARQAMTESSHSIGSIQDSIYLELKRRLRVAVRTPLAQNDGNNLLEAKPFRRRSRSTARPGGDVFEKMSRSWPKEIDHKGSEETSLDEVKVLLENVKKSTNSKSNSDGFQIQEVTCGLQWSKASAPTVSSSSIDDGDDEHDYISASSDGSDTSLEEMLEEIWKRFPVVPDLPWMGPPHRSRSLSRSPQRQWWQDKATRNSLPCTPIQTNRKKLASSTQLKDPEQQTASVSSASADMLHISHLDLFLELYREDDAKSGETSMNASDFLVVLDQSSQLDLVAQSSISSNENEEDTSRKEKAQLMTPQELITYLRDHNHKDLPESSYYQDATVAKYQTSSKTNQYVMTAEEMADILNHVASHHENNAEIRWDVIARMALGFEDPLKPIEYVFHQDEVVDLDDAASLSSISVE